MTNLLHLAERLQAREVAAPGAPASLLRWLRAQRLDEAVAACDATLLRLESDRELVQIVTLHRAKGLEYPIVFCPFAWDAGKPPSLEEGRAGVDEAGRAQIDFRPLLSKADQAAARRAADLAQRSESMRLLYVGLTRAVHRLHLGVGSYRSHGKPTESLRSPLNSLAAGGAMSADDWREHPLDEPGVLGAWAALAAAHPAHIRLQAWPAPGAGGPPAEALAPQEPPCALPPPARIPPGWSLASYSSLWLDLGHEQATADHDQLPAAADAQDDASALDAAALPEAESATAESNLPPEDFLRFPRGTAAGVCLHEVFERIDFRAPQAWPEAVAQSLQRHGLGGPPQAQAVLQMLGDVLQRPLPGAGPLGELAPERRLTELEFHLAAPRLDLAALARLMAEAGLGEVALRRHQLSGYLRGFVDLVFEHEGRWHIVDWKSNHLGFAPSDYAGAALEAAMRAHGYRLQALFYALALHRWLGRRRAGYAAAQHFGGVHYLFLRGLRPEWPQAGVHSWQPPPALLEAASALFDGEPSA